MRRAVPSKVVWVEGKAFNPLMLSWAKHCYNFWSEVTLKTMVYEIFIVLFSPDYKRRDLSIKFESTGKHNLKRSSSIILAPYEEFAVKTNVCLPGNCLYICLHGCTHTHTSDIYMFFTESRQYALDCNLGCLKICCGTLLWTVPVVQIFFLKRMNFIFGNSQMSFRAKPW